MSKKIISILFVFGVIFISLALFGCKAEKIKFYRESKAAALIEKFSPNTPPEKKVQNASGMVIYRAGEGTASGQSPVRFGPRDLDFDLPIKF